MTIFQTHEQMYQFKHLPAYANFLLAQHIDDYVWESIHLSRKMQVPLLKYLAHLSEAELFQFSKATSVEFLTYVRENRIKQQIEESLQKWLSNQLPIVGKYDIDAQDITLINFVRSQVLKHWLKAYTTDIDLILKLNTEIDTLTLGQNTTSANAYIQILKERIEEELHFSQNLIHASPGITYIFDLKEQREIYINGRVEEIMGQTPEDVLAMGSDMVAQVAHPEDMRVLAAFLGEVMHDREGKTIQAEYRFKDKQGQYHWLRTYAVVYKRDEHGVPTQALGSSFEISNEKEIATALKKREQQLLEAQAIAHIGSYEWDLIHDTSESTQELRHIFEADQRQTYEEMMAHVYPEDKRKLRHALQVALTTGSYNCEFRYVAKSGVKVLDSKGVVAFDSAGKPVKMTGTIQDVTLRKQIEENLLKKTLELERSNMQLQEFASVASHDLKEPLRKIAMFSDIILTSDWDSLPENTKTNLTKITAAAQRMQQLIEGILTYSAVEAEGRKEHCSLEKLLEEALSNLEYRIKQTKAVVHSDGLPAAAVIPYQIQQLFQNLIANAIKFSKKDVAPEINITHKVLTPVEVNSTQLQPADQYLQIQVSDNGIGFTSEASEKIFGLFQRLHSKSAYEGSGLGLAISRKIVENHGGTIAVIAEPENGATFTVILPID